MKSKTHKQKIAYGIVGKQYEFLAPEIDGVNYLLIDTIEDCRNKYFHSFDYRCVNDIKSTNMESNEEIIL